MANSSDRIAKQYVLEKEIQRSKNSTIHLGHDEKGNRPVAIKIVNKASITNKVRLLQVTEAVARIEHPNVLRIYSAGELENGDVYIVSELLDGFSLNNIVPKDVGLSLPDAWPIMMQVCDGVAAAHQSGILHLDLKPSNIFVAHDEEDNETFKIIDFGISQFISEQTDSAVGTPGYVAPELITRSDSASIQSDVYGLGALLAFLLIGSRPFDGENNQRVLENQVRGQLARTLPGSIQVVVTTATNPDPHKRHISVKAFKDALSQAHREAIMIPESNNDSLGEPSENVVDFGFGRFMIASVVLGLVGVTLMLYFWLISGT